MDAYAFIEREQDIIASIQQSLLCHQLPYIPGFRFFADYQPSSKASGDYYDFIRIDDEHLGILVADFSGHGLPGRGHNGNDACGLAVIFIHHWIT